MRATHRYDTSLYSKYALPLKVNTAFGYMVWTVKSSSKKTNASVLIQKVLTLTNDQTSAPGFWPAINAG